MITAQPAQFIHQQDRTYILVADVPQALMQKISDVQQLLGQHYSDAIWLMPRPALHITLYELMQRGSFSEGKDEFFAAHRTQIMAALTAVFARQTAIQLHFNKIIASPQAIICTAEAAEEFNQLRDEITSTVPLPSDTKQPPSIVHITIARYTKPIEVDMVNELVSSINVSEAVTVNAIELRKTSLQPMLQYDVLESFPLA